MTEPWPAPDPDPATVIHETALVAVQAHPSAVVTVMVPDSPAPTAMRVIGVMEYEHAAPSWLTRKPWPATVTVAVRGVVPLFAATLKVTVPFPDPLEPPVTVTHGAPLTAVQVHPAGAVTVTLGHAAVAGTAELVADNVKVQAPAAWVTVTVRPAIVIVPVRAVPDVFAATL